MDYDNNPIEELAEVVFASAVPDPRDGFDRALWRVFLDSGLDQVLCTGEASSQTSARI
jgi:hypothetical protein